jgi:hypothetical protein
MVFAQIKEEGEPVNPSRWVADTRATNHITGTCSAFFELDVACAEP